MHRRLIALLLMPLASFLVLAMSGQTAHADTTSGEATTQTSQSHTITVQPGDYLAKLAQDNGTTYVRLFYANDEIKDPNLIYPSEQLRVPSADEALTPRPIPDQTVVPTQPAATAAPQVVTQSVAPQPTYSAPAPHSAPAVVIPAGTSVWDELAACESGGNWSINTGNGFYGGLQFTLSSWQGVGGSGYPNQASRSEQIYRGQLLQARQGWGAWPLCSAKLGLR